MIVKLLTEHHLEFLSLKGGCRGSSESTNVKMPHCWKSHALAHIIELTWRRPNLLNGWLVGFVALRPKSTAMAIAGRSVHLATLFPGQA